MHVLYKHPKNLGRAKTDMIHVSCIFSHDCWKPEHGAWSRVAVPTGLCCSMLSTFNQTLALWMHLSVEDGRQNKSYCDYYIHQA